MQLSPLGAIGKVLPISPPRVDSSKGPNRVNRAHWPTKENSDFLIFVWSHGLLFGTPRPIFFKSHGLFFGTPRPIFSRVMDLFFGPLGKHILESWASFLDP